MGVCVKSHDSHNKHWPAHETSNKSPPKEDEIRDFGARRDLTGISQLCGHGCSRREEFKEFRCQDFGIENFENQLGCLQRVKRSGENRKENCKKLPQDLQFPRASRAYQSPSVVREGGVSRQPDLQLEANPFDGKHNMHIGESPLIGIRHGVNMRMRHGRTGRKDPPKLQRSSSTPGRSAASAVSAAVSPRPPTSPRSVPSPRRPQLPEAPKRKSQDSMGNH